MNDLKTKKEKKWITRNKLIIGIFLIAVVLIIKENINPYFMMGIPVGVFGINNMDSMNHSINVQVFDSNNTLIIKETYRLGYSQPGQWVPEQSINYPENGWKSVQDKERLFPNGYYTFIITFDNNVAQPFKKYLDTWSQVNIAIDNHGNLSVGEAIV